MLLLFPRYAPFFMAGMVFYLLQTKQAAPWKLYLVLLASYGLSLRSSRAIMDDMVPFFKEPFSLPVVWTVVTGFFVAFLLIINRKLRLGYARLLTWAGALTYPIYLLHHNMGFVILQRLGGKVDKHLLLITLLAAVFLLAYGLHVLVERRYSTALGQKLQQLLAKA
ncbi:acyltransferase family protein [Hymenobacter terrenus]|uniref:hypothetical protein n=1 Tax=Hymenobacter terrenus TaxID=1629124 RepID=UPI000619C1A6|nr:hypothetical protein [Hymenobacter terrenus]